MDTNQEPPRNWAEIRAIAAALSATRGAAPSWLQAEMQGPLSLPPIPADPDAYRWHMKAALSVGALLAAFLCGVDFVPEVGAATYNVPRPVYVADLDAQDAIAIVQGSSMAGDDRPVAQRLGADVRRADGSHPWTAERTGDDTYLVLFREPAGVPAYAFEVDLESGLVQPTPEAVDALALLKVREHEEQHLVATAD